MALQHSRIFRCTWHECELQFCHPQPTDEQLARYYTEIYYPTGNESPELQSAPDEDFRTWLFHVEQRLGSMARKRVLDYGCGEGSGLRIGGEKGAVMTGVEQSANAREKARRAQLSPVHASLDELRCAEPGARFDWILLCVVIEHLRRPWEDLRQLRLLLSPGGTIVISTPNFGSLKSRVLRGRWQQRANRTHLYFFTPKSLRAVIRHAGLQAERWPAMAEYRTHGLLRRSLQRMLRMTNLQGDLLFAAALPLQAAERARLQYRVPTDTHG